MAFPDSSSVLDKFQSAMSDKKKNSLIGNFEVLGLLGV